MPFLPEPSSQPNVCSYEASVHTLEPFFFFFITNFFSGNKKYESIFNSLLMGKKDIKNMSL